MQKSISRELFIGEANLAHYEKSAVNTAKLKNRRPVVMANISTGVNDDKVA